MSEITLFKCILSVMRSILYKNTDGKYQYKVLSDRDENRKNPLATFIYLIFYTNRTVLFTVVLTIPTTYS
jgi:hypothetical protein